MPAEVWIGIKDVLGGSASGHCDDNRPLTTRATVLLSVGRPLFGFQKTDLDEFLRGLPVLGRPTRMEFLCSFTLGRVDGRLVVCQRLLPVKTIRLFAFAAVCTPKRIATTTTSPFGSLFLTRARARKTSVAS